MLAYRSSVHEATGRTPANLLFGRELCQPADLLYGHPEEHCKVNEEYVSHLQKGMEDTVFAAEGCSWRLHV